ncbi:MAG: UPF0149 family protein [Burkholderiaceae bacterium]
MTNASSSQALTEDELNQLDDFLGAIGSTAMNLETLDGFFAALICGPEIALPSEYLPLIWGEDYSFANNAQAVEIVGLLMRHWNTIADTLQGTLEVPDVYLPVLHVAEDGISYGNDWALGFMRGIGTRPYGWRELIDSDEFGGPMLPIMMLAHENDPDPEMRPNPILPEKRDDLLQEMIAGLTRIYRYFEPHRRSGAHAPLRRAGPKVGRNDPCPCGSGKKYKFCCAATAPTLH